ncbi:MAG: hypothetical protein E7462_00820 [Ruminococcaceae bacterium]|nr:hypothetical protein [Oscillospiraceae bacterium]
MTDLHTHILPGMDDGAQTVEQSLELLRMQAEQGVETVALTPHFYRSRESAPDFLARRAEAWGLLERVSAGQLLPKLILGAEVAWTPGMADLPELDDLCYTGSNILLVELPVSQWDDEMFRQLYSMEVRRGIMPMIAHLDRYFQNQRKRDMDRLLEMGYPIQISAEALFHRFARKKALDMLENYDALLISDCHNLPARKPNMGDAMKVIEKKCGKQIARRIAENTDIVLEG